MKQTKYKQRKTQKNHTRGNRIKLTGGKTVPPSVENLLKKRRETLSLISNRAIDEILPKECEELEGRRQSYETKAEQWRRDEKIKCEIFYGFENKPLTFAQKILNLTDKKRKIITSVREWGRNNYPDGIFNDIMNNYSLRKSFCQDVHKLTRSVRKRAKS